MSTENQIINKILKDKSMNFVFDNNLTRDYFPVYQDQFDFIYKHYQEYNSVPDLMTFLDQFRDFEVFEVNESDEYLADAIRENYLYTQMVPIIRQAHDLTISDASGAVEYLAGKVPTLQQLKSGKATNLVGDGAEKRLQQFVEHRDSVSGLMLSGMKELDEIMNGWSRGEELAILLARPNQGKSWMLLKFAMLVWLQNYNVGFYSGEMSPNLLGYRFDTLLKGFSNKGLMTGSPELYENYLKYIEDLKASKVLFNVVEPKDLHGRATIPKLKSFVEKFKIDFLVVDQLSLMDDYRARKNDDLRVQYGHITEDLFAMSQFYNIPVLAASQANRGGKIDYGPPELEHIAESDSVGQNASKVIAIRQNDGTLEMQIRKNRGGKLGDKLIYTWDIDTGTHAFDRIDKDSGMPSDNKANQRVYRPANDDAIERHIPQTPVEVF